jgi:hypothetical protein
MTYASYSRGQSFASYRMKSSRSAQSCRDSRQKARQEGTCPRCFIRPSLVNYSLCSWCRAELKEGRRRWMQHDTAEHAWMIALCYELTSECAASGLTLAQLRCIGEKLTVDRIDSRQGYVGGNMQLLALRLNNGKGDRAEVPVSALNALHRKYGRYQERARSLQESARAGKS